MCAGRGGSALVAARHAWLASSPCCPVPLPSPVDPHTLLSPHSAPGLNPEPVRQGSELSARINAVLRQLRGSKELWQVGGLGLWEVGLGRRGELFAASSTKPVESSVEGGTACKHC